MRLRCPKSVAPQDSAPIIPLFDGALKLVHGCLSWLADALACENLPDSHPDDLKVQPDRAVIHIPDIQGELLFPGDGIAPVDLRPAGDTGAQCVASRLLRRVERQVAHEQRTWPHQPFDCAQDRPHLPAQHVPEFWQFIQAAAAQDQGKNGEQEVEEPLSDATIDGGRLFCLHGLHTAKTYLQGKACHTNRVPHVRTAARYGHPR